MRNKGLLVMSATNQELVRALDRGALWAALLGAFLVTSLHGAQALAAGSSPTVKGDYGTIANGGATLSGTWNQGRDLPLTFSRDTFVAAKKPSAVDGFWLGALSTPGGSLRIQLTIKSDVNGSEVCTLDSLDQSAYGLSCANAKLTGTAFSFDVPVVHGHFAGRLSDDGASLDGTWTQNAALPLNLRREARPIAPPPPPKVSYQPAIAPVSAATMQSVLTRDLRQALASGALAPATSARRPPTC
jgi:serine-type D-Ala-D-Ala carboxypeptidase/endopeptidase